MNADVVESGEVEGQSLLGELRDFVNRGPDKIFIKSDQHWSRQEFVNLASKLAAGLQQFAIQRGDAVGLLMGNLREYYLADTATLFLGGVPISLYPTSAPEQLAYMVRDAGIRVLFTEAAYLQMLVDHKEQFSGLSTVITVDAAPVAEGAYPWPVFSLEQLLQGGRALDLDVAISQANPQEVLTQVYTSGTTGAPKGVPLTHENLLAAAHSMGLLMQLEEGGRIISWLPHAHVAGRSGQYYCAIVFGLEVTLCPDPQQLPQYLPAVRPTWFFAVPRVWEKLKAAIEAEFSKLPETAQADIHAAMAVALIANTDSAAKDELSAEAMAKLQQAEVQVFAPLRAKLGLDKAKVLNTGTAPTPQHVLEFFAGLGLPIGDIFGSTETCACGSMGRPGSIRLGSAGKAVSGMEIRIAADGEILLRGKPVMCGYHGQPEKTAEVLTQDGWYHTGDIGRLDEDGYLWVTDRKKELMINSSGKNMSPANIEAMIKSGHPLISQVCVIGDQRPYNIALLVLEPDYAKAWAALRNLETDMSELAGHPDIRAMVAQGVANGNARLSRVEQIKKYVILGAEWYPGGDELTATMKLKRKAVEDKYATQIEQLYQATD